jgi:hypothetical protein
MVVHKLSTGGRGIAGAKSCTFSRQYALLEMVFASAIYAVLIFAVEVKVKRAIQADLSLTIIPLILRALHNALASKTILPQPTALML